jgi:hypothetical protein
MGHSRQYNVKARALLLAISAELDNIRAKEFSLCQEKERLEAELKESLKQIVSE